MTPGTGENIVAFPPCATLTQGVDGSTRLSVVDAGPDSPPSRVTPERRPRPRRKQLQETAAFQRSWQALKRDSRVFQGRHDRKLTATQRRVDKPSDDAADALILAVGLTLTPLAGGFLIVSQMAKTPDAAPRCSSRQALLGHAASAAGRAPGRRQQRNGWRLLIRASTMPRPRRTSWPSGGQRVFWPAERCWYGASTKVTFRSASMSASSPRRSNKSMRPATRYTSAPA